MVLFPPVDVVQVLSGGVHAVLPLISPLEVFCTYIMALVCMGLQRPASDIKQESIIYINNL